MATGAVTSRVNKRPCDHTPLPTVTALHGADRSLLQDQKRYTRAAQELNAKQATGATDPAELERLRGTVVRHRAVQVSRPCPPCLRFASPFPLCPSAFFPGQGAGPVQGGDCQRAIAVPAVLHCGRAGAHQGLSEARRACMPLDRRRLSCALHAAQSTLPPPQGN